MSLVHQGRNGGPPSPSTLDMTSADGTEILDLRGKPSALEAVTRAEVDIQITTAKRYPRSIERFQRKAEQMIGAPGIAEQCRYQLPARKGGGDGDGKSGPISGPSVRLAEIVACCWGNLRIAGRIIDDDGRFITAQAVAMDLEENLGYAIEVKRRVTNKEGRRYSDDMYQVTCNAAIAIATRNATFKAIPRAFVSHLEDLSIAVIRGDVKSFPERLERAVSWFATKGVVEADLYRVIGVLGYADLSIDHLITLQALRQSVLDGQATIAEIFTPELTTSSATGQTRTNDLKDRLGLPEATAPPASSVIPARTPSPVAEPAFREGTSGVIRSEAEEPTVSRSAEASPPKRNAKPKPADPETLPWEPGSDG